MRPRGIGSKEFVVHDVLIFYHSLSLKAVVYVSISFYPTVCQTKGNIFPKSLKITTLFSQKNIVIGEEIIYNRIKTVAKEEFYCVKR